MRNLNLSTSNPRIDIPARLLLAINFTWKAIALDSLNRQERVVALLRDPHTGAIRIAKARALVGLVPHAAAVQSLFVNLIRDEPLDLTLPCRTSKILQFSRNFGRLVLGCIEPKSCKSIVNSTKYSVCRIWGKSTSVAHVLHRSGLKVSQNSSQMLGFNFKMFVLQLIFW